MRSLWFSILGCAQVCLARPTYCPQAILTADLLDLRYVRPSQFEAGWRAVDYRYAKLAEKDADQLQRYLAKRPIPVIFGPQQVYVEDRHHLALALLRLNHFVAPYRVTRDWRDLDPDAFEAKMIAKRHVRLRDAMGVGRFFDELPMTLDGLADDPYRSLAYFVRKAGGFCKTPAQFSEFDWADYFRSHLDVGTTDVEFGAAIARGVNWAHADYASDLPGFLSWEDVKAGRVCGDDD